MCKHAHKLAGPALTLTGDSLDLPKPAEDLQQRVLWWVSLQVTKPEVP